VRAEAGRFLFLTGVASRVADPWEAKAWYARAIEQGYCPGELAGPEQVLETGLR